MRADRRGGVSRRANRGGGHTVTFARALKTVAPAAPAAEGDADDAKTTAMPQNRSGSGAAPPGSGTPSVIVSSGSAAPVGDERAGRGGAGAVGGGSWRCQGGLGSR